MGMYAFLSKGDLIEMNNKKLSRLLEPNLKLYFLCMIVFAAATATGEPASGTGGDRLHRGPVCLFHQP